MFFFNCMQKIRQGDYFHTFLKKRFYLWFKQVIRYLVLVYFDRLGVSHTIKTNFVTFQIANSEIYLILTFYEELWDYLLHQILCMNFQGKYF